MLRWVVVGLVVVVVGIARTLPDRQRHARASSSRTPSDVTERGAVSVRAVTDFDADGALELWVEVDIYKRIWTLYELGGTGFIEDCKAGA